MSTHELRSTDLARFVRGAALPHRQTEPMASRLRAGAQPAEHPAHTTPPSADAEPPAVVQEHRQSPAVPDVPETPPRECPVTSISMTVGQEPRLQFRTTQSASRMSVRDDDEYGPAPRLALGCQTASPSVSCLRCPSTPRSSTVVSVIVPTLRREPAVVRPYQGDDSRVSSPMIQSRSLAAAFRER